MHKTSAKVEFYIHISISLSVILYLIWNTMCFPHKYFSIKQLLWPSQILKTFLCFFHAGPQILGGGQCHDVPNPSVGLSGCLLGNVQSASHLDLVTEPNHSPKVSQHWLPGHWIRSWFSLLLISGEKVNFLGFYSFQIHADWVSSFVPKPWDYFTALVAQNSIISTPERHVALLPSHHQVLTASWVRESLSDSSEQMLGGFESVGRALQRLYCS